MKTKEAWEVAHEFMDNVDHCDCGNMNFDRDKLEETLKSHAKQQAIAFFEFCLPGPVDFEPYVSLRYDQFIESLNKQQ